MPEYPEITVYIERLVDLIKGQILEQARFTSPFLLRTAEPPIDSMKGEEVQGFERIGKRIVFVFAKEHFLVLLLDTRGQVTKISEVSVGTLDSSIVHPREVFKEAISASAASVIFCHNHPSGDPEPSEDDIKLTERMVQAGEVMGIDVLDHIIIGDKQHLSLKSKGLF